MEGLDPLYHVGVGVAASPGVLDLLPAALAVHPLVVPVDEGHHALGHVHLALEVSILSWQLSLVHHGILDLGGATRVDLPYFLYECVSRRGQEQEQEQGVRQEQRQWQGQKVRQAEARVRRQTVEREQDPFYLFGQVLGSFVGLLGQTAEVGGEFLERQAELNEPLLGAVGNISSTLHRSGFAQETIKVANRTPELIGSSASLVGSTMDLKLKLLSQLNSLTCILLRQCGSKRQP